MKPQHSITESSGRRRRLADWPAGDSYLALMESQLIDLAEINEIGMTFIRHLDAQAEALAVKGGKDLAEIARSRRQLSREIRLNKKLAAEINEDRKRRIAELGIVQH